jgi:hypothetical protein
VGLAKAGGCLLEKVGGITKLSELTIDADKDWLTFGITNIKEVAAGMQKGDLPFFDGAGIAILVPGPIGTMLTTQGLGADPIWSY